MIASGLIVRELLPGLGLGWIPAALCGLGLLSARAPITVARALAVAVGALLAVAVGFASLEGQPLGEDAGLVLTPTFALDGLSRLGLLLAAAATATVGAVAESRRELAGALVVTGVAVAVWVAGDLVTLATSLLVLPVALVVATAREDQGSQNLAIWTFAALSLAGLAIAGAAALAAVERFNASAGRWTLELASLSVQPGLFSERAVLVALALGSLTLLGAWPLHGWIRDGVVHAPRSLAIVMLGPLRWLGLSLLLALGSRFAGSAWFEFAGWLAALGTFGALVGAGAGLHAQDVRDLLARTAPVPAGVALVGVLGGSLEGIVGAFMLALGHGLAAAAALADRRERALGPAAAASLLGVPGLAALVGAALVLIGTARFARVSLPSAAWIAALLVVVLVLHACAIARVLASPAGDESDEPRGAVVVVVAALAATSLAIGVLPGLITGPAVATARARADALFRGRCVTLVLGPAERARTLDAAPPECDAAIRTVYERTRAARREDGA